MSNWTMAEVELLKQENGGGNAVNAAKMFAKFPAGGPRPKKGCHPDDMKAFVQEAYNDLRWYDESGQVPGAAAPPQVQQRTASMQAPPPTKVASGPPPVSVSKSAPVQDLFGDFGSAPAPA